MLGAFQTRAEAAAFSGMSAAELTEAALSTAVEALQPAAPSAAGLSARSASALRRAAAAAKGLSGAAEPFGSVTAANAAPEAATAPVTAVDCATTCTPMASCIMNTPVACLTSMPWEQALRGLSECTQATGQAAPGMPPFISETTTVVPSVCH